MTNSFIVFLAGGCGSVLRYLVGLAVPSALFPWATIGVNALGSFAIGLFGALAARFGWSEGVRLALTVGLCGGFTTFSTFSREALALATSGRARAFCHMPPAASFSVSRWQHWASFVYAMRRIGLAKHQ